MAAPACSGVRQWPLLGAGWWSYAMPPMQGARVASYGSLRPRPLMACGLRSGARVTVIRDLRPYRAAHELARANRVRSSARSMQDESTAPALAASPRGACTWAPKRLSSCTWHQRGAAHRHRHGEAHGGACERLLGCSGDLATIRVRATPTCTSDPA